MRENEQGEFGVRAAAGDLKRFEARCYGASWRARREFGQRGEEERSENFGVRAAAIELRPSPRLLTDCLDATGAENWVTKRSGGQEERSESFWDSRCRR